MASRLLMVLLLLTACTAGQTSPWTRVGPALGLVEGWDGGFLAFDQGVSVSEDGRDWDPAHLDGLEEPIATAAHGPAAYVLGTTAVGLSVWRSEDGNKWEDTPLADSGDATVALAAGPHGVLVVRSDPEDAGLRYWRSDDGRSFDALKPLPGAEDVLPNTALLVVATPDGFLVEPGYAAGSGSVPVDDEPEPIRVYSSPDGVEWEDIARGLPELSVDGLAGNGGTVVLVATPLGDEGQQVWFRRDGVWRRAGIDPGRLPDPAVGTAVGRTLDRVRDWGGGFVLLGHTVTSAGYLWTSADGSGWSRYDDRAFDSSRVYRDFAVGPAVLVTSDADAWVGDVRPSFAAEPPRPPDPPAPTTTPGLPQYAEDVPVFDPWTQPRAPATTSVECASPSAVADRGDAWTCTSGDVTYDPCFAHRSEPEVACWSDANLLVFRVPSALPDDGHRSVLSWRMDLDGGDKCVTYRGPPLNRGEEILVMTCLPGSRARYVWGWTSADGVATSTTPDGPLTTTTVTAQYR
ncbi:hypothetical protein AB0425_34020 [Actinosynnema sp. NPDC051121]